MPKRATRAFVSTVIACLVLAHASAAAEATRRGLVDVDWLSSNLGAGDIVLLDASMPQIHASKHIPGAVSADFLTYGFPERPLAEAESRYQAWGISAGKKVVIYDQGGTYMATRLLFALYHHGFPADSLFILDGGLAKWEEKGQPVTKESTPAPPRGTFRIQATNEDVRVRLPEFLAASGDPANNLLLEALGPDTHFGEVAFFDRAGHIPNAVLLPSADFFNPDKTFKSTEDLARILAYLGVKPEMRVHTHCGGGVAASVPFFALTFLLNYPRVTLFQESQMGWLSDERQLPFWTYDMPSLMRDASWLQAWAGQRLRMFRPPGISIVDVRSADAYGQGHVPYAVNTPAEVFRSHVRSPATIAQVLGAAGVDPSHEAVIVSGAGLTKDAALAFVLMEKLGQKKVSVLLDSMEQWSQRGLPISKEPTLVGPPKGPGVQTVPSVAYPGAMREGVMIGDPESTRGAYPKVFVASGAHLPASVPAGKVVHVPYTSLLDASGAPKAAKDVWNTLAKAGVPRYAELICIADDPGDAAANYFLLKLMGFPDVKVLAK